MRRRFNMIVKKPKKMGMKEFKTKTAIGDLVASSPFISRKEKKKIIKRMF